MNELELGIEFVGKAIVWAILLSLYCKDVFFVVTILRSFLFLDLLVIYAFIVHTHLSIDIAQDLYINCVCTLFFLI